MNMTTTEMWVLNLTVVVSPDFSIVMVSTPILLPSRVMSKTSFFRGGRRRRISGGRGIGLARMGKKTQREKSEQTEKKSVLSGHRSLFRNERHLIDRQS